MYDVNVFMSTRLVLETLTIATKHSRTVSLRTTTVDDVISRQQKLLYFSATLQLARTKYKTVKVNCFISFSFSFVIVVCVAFLYQFILLIFDDSPHHDNATPTSLTLTSRISSSVLFNSCESDQLLSCWLCAVCMCVRATRKNFVFDWINCNDKFLSMTKSTFRSWHSIQFFFLVLFVFFFLSRFSFRLIFFLFLWLLFVRVHLSISIYFVCNSTDVM